MYCNNRPHTSSTQRALWALTYPSDKQNFSDPMMWVGIYIAIASLFCILPMVADLLHGLKNRKLWFPCKHFTLNAASLSVIAVAMKLPMDLNNSMPGDVDQAAKLGSMAFMCTMMANLLPSLALMNTKELLTHTIALGVLIITLVVNVCIQIQTGVVANYDGANCSLLPYLNQLIAIVYVATILVLLLIHICSTLMILKSKKILESRYQEAHETALKDQEQQPRRLTVEKLKQLVSNHWIMAETGSPQFMITCYATTSASGVICALTTVLHVTIMIFTTQHITYYASDYKWSNLVIFITQFVGVVLGTIAPLSRCFASLSFKLSTKWIWSHIKIFKVESYCTQKLSDWKQSNIPFSSKSRKCKIIFQNVKVLILSVCIGIQNTIVVVCKIIALIPVFFVICALYGWRWLEAMFSLFHIVLVQKPKQIKENKELRKYVLQLQDDMELAERTLKGISKSMNRVIQEAVKQQPKYLMKLLEKSSTFEGVRNYDRHHQLPPLPTEKYIDCWSLPVVTMTTIAMSLPDIQTKIVDRLVRSVSEGLAYVKLVEETLNPTDNYASIQKAANKLWLEVEVYHKWFGHKLQNHAPQVNTTGKILQWFSNMAKNIVTKVKSSNIGIPNDSSEYMSVCANSMYRVTQTILLSYNEDIDQVSQEELFLLLSSMISDILAACLTNLPQVIALKCNANGIEKWEASVHAAAQLLGETMHIISSLQDRLLPSLSPDDLAFIDKWHDNLKHSFP